MILNNLYLSDLNIIKIGKSKINNAIFTLTYNIGFPEFITFYSMASKFKDTFIITTNRLNDKNLEITITRTDINTGWGQDLKLTSNTRHFNSLFQITIFNKHNYNYLYDNDKITYLIINKKINYNKTSIINIINKYHPNIYLHEINNLNNYLDNNYVFILTHNKEIISPYIIPDTISNTTINNTNSNSSTITDGSMNETLISEHLNNSTIISEHIINMSDTIISDHLSNSTIISEHLNDILDDTLDDTLVDTIISEHIDNHISDNIISNKINASNINNNLPKLHTTKIDEIKIDMNNDNILTKKYHDICILLTTYNEESRTILYTKRIKWWINNTNLPIYIVDSNNIGFPELLDEYKKSKRIFCYSFNQNDYIKKNKYHQTKYELLSLKNAFNYFKDAWNQYTMIFKITGKYVLPELETKISTIPYNNDIVLQQRHKFKWQNTEIIGISKKIFMSLLNSLDDNKIFEKIIFLELHKYTTSRLDKLQIPVEFYTKTKKGYTYNSL